jgi:hypothetical protein
MVISKTNKTNFRLDNRLDFRYRVETELLCFPKGQRQSCSAGIQSILQVALQKRNRNEYISEVDMYHFVTCLCAGLGVQCFASHGRGESDF